MSLQLQCGKNRCIKTELPAFIMGIVNATPDSFYRQSSSIQLQKNLERALDLEKQGADIIDIGGESTRPGAMYVSAEEELERVIPLIQELRSRTDIPISVDTRKSAVMREAFRAGADICNDISALSDDGMLAELIAEAGGSVVLMHKRGIPLTMQNNANNYRNIIEDVYAYLKERADYARTCGIAKDRIIVDYGIGFGKTAEDNWHLVAASFRFASLGYPLLAGLSRKSFIGAITGKDVEQRLTGSLAAAMYAVQQGVSILRVHDVQETYDMLAVLGELEKYGTH